MMSGHRPWPAMATVLLALLVCLVELVDADSNPQPAKGAKDSGSKHSHSSLRHFLKLANRLVHPDIKGLLSKWLYKDPEGHHVEAKGA
ncbi:caltrin-like [Dama dama]|uniref:caltrin-like n=1 Tax=Dama dama TaxID=30532 RepID=UPI002A35F6FB|nr:caltrin-like [Dama dama]